MNEDSQKELKKSIYDWFYKNSKERVNYILESIKKQINKLHNIFEKMNCEDLDRFLLLELCEQLINVCKEIIDLSNCLKIAVKNSDLLPDELSLCNYNSFENSIHERIYELNKKEHKSILDISKEYGLDNKRVKTIIDEETLRHFLLKSSKVYRALTYASKIIKVPNAFVKKTYTLLKQKKLVEAIDNGESFDLYSDDILYAIKGIGPKSVMLIRAAQVYLDTLECCVDKDD